MQKSQFSEARMIAMFLQVEGDMPVAELCREHGISNAGFYKWRAKYSGMDASMIIQKKALEDEIGG